jgi:cytochrome c oxidase cbb3-type subunit 3/ubiquinol-cytochrome c reductase cytochrome c subunit
VVAALELCGCHQVEGRTGPGEETRNPAEFHSLYRENCAGCHGANGKNGAAIALANPVYIAWAGKDQLLSAIANGTASKLMPPFATSAGGMLTESEVSTLVNGMMESWGAASALAGANPPAYKSTVAGDSQRGFTAYGEFCARCHGATGEGGPADGMNIPGKTGPGKSGWLGPIVEPSYLALTSDQNLRSLIVAGLPDGAMPDWRSDGKQPMSDQQVTDVVAWLASKRVATPGQPYPARP